MTGSYGLGLPRNRTEAGHPCRHSECSTVNRFDKPHQLWSSEVHPRCPASPQRSPGYRRFRCPGGGLIRR